MLLLLDWDETLTQKDTLSVISPPKAELDARNYSGPSFEWFSEQYMQDYTQHTEKYSSKEIKSIAEQCRLLDSFQEVELRSNTRIEESGFFKDWNVEDACDRARKVVELRNGVETSLKPFLNSHRQEVKTGVISVSWSSEFIKAGLNTIDSNGYIADQGSLPIDYLRSNHLDPESGKMSKKGSKGIRTALDKSREMSKILSQHYSSPQVVVYAGDSNTDLPCLLYASVGIIVGDNASLQKTLERLNLEKYVVEGYQAFVERLQSDVMLPAGQAVPQGQDIAAVLESKAKSEGFFLVKVSDWTEGTHVLEELLRRQ